MDDIKFNLICEGITDYVVIKYILAGWYDNPDIQINTLQPKITNKGQENQGGFSSVFSYCASSDFKQVFEVTNNYVIINIDTDKTHEWYFPELEFEVDFTITKEMTAECIIWKVIMRFMYLFCSKFGEQWLEDNHTRVIYSIAINATDCWLVSLDTKLKPKNFIKNCHHTLNNIPKTEREYKKISIDFANQKKLNAAINNNGDKNGLSQFVAALPQTQKKPIP